MSFHLGLPLGNELGYRGSSSGPGIGIGAGPERKEG